MKTKKKMSARHKGDMAYPPSQPGGHHREPELAKHFARNTSPHVTETSPGANDRFSMGKKHKRGM